MTQLRPTVKRDLSLFSVQSWEKGYRLYLKQFLSWSYPVIFYYDGTRVNFYHKQTDFDYFKQVVTPQLINDTALFSHLNSQFLANIARLKNIMPTPDNLPTVSRLIGQIMAFYIFIVSDSFVAARPEAWPSRHASEGILYEIDAAVEQVMDEALHKTNIDPELAHVMTLSEWRVRGELDDKLIQARRRHYIMTNQKIETDLTFQNYCHKHHLINPEDTMTKETAELSGQTAYPGTVQGPVRLIHNRDDLRTIKKGEILVAIMTNATYTPYFKKVKAIITDEGGVTCHAAIVARELKKPCIIGTKNATKVLNDGDLIEVDAHQGVVKLIERAE